MSFPLHESIHIVASVIAGLIAWKLHKRFWGSMLAAFLGGVLIDLDHFIDYFMVFGPTFNLNYFIHGYQFLKSGKVHIFFHAWEYIVPLFLLFLVVKKNKFWATFIVAFTLAMFSHLLIDTLTNDMYFKAYFITKRVEVNFDTEKLVPPEHYQDDLKRRVKIFLKDLKK